ncbi:MAG TPA: NnrU family protein [Solimonas sp.]|nr:NnrU family protein [Solimonas sp.]
MTSLVAACVLFVGIHLLISGTPVRAALVARMGERRYTGLFSALSGVALAWMIWAFIHTRVVIPTGLQGYRWVAMLLVFVAFQFIVLGLMTRSPTAVGGEGALDDPEAARGILRITRHPFLWGIALWAATHAVYNPQAPTLWFFGSFLVLALIGPPSIDRKRAHKLGERWTRYAAVTSNIPFAAILQGRNHLVWRELTGGKLAVGAAAYLAFLLLHRFLFGVQVM